MARTTQAAVRESNVRDILQLVVGARARISRADIVRATGLTSATVSSIVGELIERGYVQEAGRADSTGGKPATSLEVTTDTHFVATLMITPHRIAAVLVDLAGAARKRTETIIPDRTVTIDDAAAALTELVRRVPSILAVGVQLPGVVDGGWLRESIPLGLADIDVAARLSAATDAPTHLINDASAEALREFSVQGDPAGSQVFISLSTGLGAALIVNGRLIRGESNRSGEIGHVPVLHGPDAPLCACGNRGCLEEVASITSILGLPYGTDLDAVDFDAALADPATHERMLESARHLVPQLLLVAAAIDAPSIVLGGWARNLGPEYLAHLRAQSGRRHIAGVTPITVSYAKAAPDTEYRGPAQWALGQTLGLHWG